MLTQGPETEIEDSLFTRYPVIWKKILPFLSTKEIYGKLPLLNKDFQRLINKVSLRSTLGAATPTQIILYSIKNISRIPEILSTKKLYHRLSFDNLLTITSLHEGIAQDVNQQRPGTITIETKSLNLQYLKTLDTDKLLLLGRSDFNIAQIVVNNKTALHVKTEGLITLGKAHLEIAKQLFEQKKLSLNSLFTLGIKHLEIARAIFKDPAIIGHPHIHTQFSILQKMIQSHPEIIELFLEKHSDLLKKMLGGTYLFLDSESICQFVFKQREQLTPPLHFYSHAAMRHQAIAEKVLADKMLVKKLNRHQPDKLFEIKAFHLSIARKYFMDPAVLNGLSPGELIPLCNKHLEFAEKVFNTPHLLNKLSNLTVVARGAYSTVLSTIFIMTVHPTIALKVFRDNDLLKKIDKRSVFRFIEENTYFLRYVKDQTILDNWFKHNQDPHIPTDFNINDLYPYKSSRYHYPLKLTFFLHKHQGFIPEKQQTKCNLEADIANLVICAANEIQITQQCAAQAAIPFLLNPSAPTRRRKKNDDAPKQPTKKRSKIEKPNP